jgi:hypothetical protein
MKKITGRKILKRKSICEEFPINNSEYFALDKELGNYAKYVSWQLIKKNAKNNHTDEFEDINQELLVSIIRAGSYYKRQIYIEQCLSVAKQYASDNFLLFLLQELEKLWHNRTRHGANRQKYGWFQEQLLEGIVKACVPCKKRPNKRQSLKIDAKFLNYAKSICWNSEKAMGKKITKEKSIRSCMASLSEHDHLQ